MFYSLKHYVTGICLKSFQLSLRINEEGLLLFDWIWIYNEIIAFCCEWWFWTSVRRKIWSKYTCFKKAYSFPFLRAIFSLIILNNSLIINVVDIFYSETARCTAAIGVLWWDNQVYKSVTALLDKSTVLSFLAKWLMSHLAAYSHSAAA